MATSQNTQGTSASGTTIGNTQNQSSIGPPPLPQHAQARISQQRESLLLAAHPPEPPVSESDGQEPTTAEQDLIAIEIGDALLEYLRDTNYVYLRQTTPESDWYEFQEDPEPDTDTGTSFYSISTGQHRTEGNVVRNNKIDVTITNAKNL